MLEGIIVEFAPIIVYGAFCLIVPIVGAIGQLIGGDSRDPHYHYPDDEVDQS